jgi:magnesium chelatase family protein
LLDRIDLQIETQPVEIEAMADRTPGEKSEDIRKRVIAARLIQQERFKNEPGIYCNAQMNSRLLHRHAWPDEEGLTRLKTQMARLNMSARAFDRILKVARTIADLDASPNVESRHISEAISYRNLDRANWGVVSGTTQNSIM